MWELFFEAYKQAKIKKEYQKNLKRFLSVGGLDYIALQNMVNQALAGVEINITLPDATRLEIRREDPLNRASKILDRELY